VQIRLSDIGLRRVESKDAEALYAFKNDPEITALLGGFSVGYSTREISAWINRHQETSDDIVWTITALQSDQCIGHVGLYRIDHRIRSAEFAILVGDKERWGRGLGCRITHAVLQYAFDELNLNRVSLSVLESNRRAQALYRRLGFQVEGCMRQAQYKGGRYVDIIVMGLLAEEFDAQAQAR